VASSYSSLAWHYEMIVAVDLEKSLEVLSYQLPVAETLNDSLLHSGNSGHLIQPMIPD